jgi:type II secretory pathway component PulK
MRRTRGFILLYVLAMVAALTLMLLQLQQRSTGVPRQTERELNHAVQWQEASMLLDFVIAGTVERRLPVDPRFTQFRRLLAEDPARLSELEDALAQLKEMLDQMGFSIDIGRGKGGVALGTKRDDEGTLFLPRHEDYTLKLGEREYRVRVVPANARPNLNALPYEPMWRYLEYLGVPAEEAKDLAANIVDWRDPDMFRTENRGAEQEYYLELAEPYRPRNAPVLHWQELAYVKGMSPDRLQLLRENFSLSLSGRAAALGDYIQPRALVALSGLKADTVQALLRAYGGRPEKGETTALEVTEMALTEQDIAAFDATVTFRPDMERLRIEVLGTEVALHVDLDLPSRRELGRW